MIEDGANANAPGAMEAARLAPGMTRAVAVRTLARALAAAGIEGAAREARLLAAHALGLSPSDLLLAGAQPLDAVGSGALDACRRRRLSGEPVARILGTWEFWSLPFRLSPATLVPRPDTETLVEAALARLPDRLGPARLLDLGTGSGCILVALLSERPRALGLGIDRAPEALATARANAEANAVGGRVLFACGDWAAAVAGPFDLVVSNPPYIARAHLSGLDVAVRVHDPVTALDGGEDGLSAYRRIVAQAARPGLLAPGGALLLEVGFDQSEAVADLGRAAGLIPEPPLHDLAGHARVVTLRPSSDDKLPDDRSSGGRPVAGPSAP